MGMFDEFFDLERHRQTQSKAFNCNLSQYIHETDCNDMINHQLKYRTFYVQAMTPCYFIRIEGNMFTGILSIREDNITSYPVFDYYGREIKIDILYEDALKELADLYEIIEENVRKLPMKALREKYTFIYLNVVDKISKRYPEL